MDGVKMNEDKSFIKLHRKMINWEWYKDYKIKDLFIHLLLKANWKDGKYQGHDIPRGSLVTGRKQLAEELNFSEQSIRTAIKRLKSTNEITVKTTKKFSIITIVNYEQYQEINQMPNQQLTNSQPTTNQQLTTIEEYKNIRNKEYIFISCCNKAEEIFGRTINSTEVNLIKEWLEEKNYSEELIKEAMRLTIVNGKKYFNYTTGILQNWEDRGFKSLEDIRQKENKKQEPVELFDCDWINEEEN